MQLVAKQDVEAPAAQVFGQLAAFDNWERAAMRRGAEVQRSATPVMPGPGTSWQTQFDYRGRLRKMTIRIEKLTEPTQMVLSAESAPVSAMVRVDVIDLAAKRTRIEVRIEIKPKTLAARLFLQTLRLTRSRVDRRFAQTIAHLASEIEGRLRKPALRR